LSKFLLSAVAVVVGSAELTPPLAAALVVAVVVAGRGIKPLTRQARWLLRLRLRLALSARAAQLAPVRPAGFPVLARSCSAAVAAVVAAVPRQPLAEGADHQQEGVTFRAARAAPLAEMDLRLEPMAALA